MAIAHKHLIVRATVEKAPTDVAAIKRSLTELVDLIDMKLLAGYDQPEDDYKNPIASYCQDPENRGMTAIALIETSSIVLHAWDQCEPNLIEFDLYTCAKLDRDKVLCWLDQFRLIDVDYMIIDRAESLRLVENDTFHVPS